MDTKLFALTDAELERQITDTFRVHSQCVALLEEYFRREDRRLIKRLQQVRPEVPVGLADRLAGEADLRDRLLKLLNKEPS